MIRDIEIECLEESIYNKIANGYDSNQDVKLYTPLHYAICGSKDTHVVVSNDVNKLRKNCISNALRMWVLPNTIVSSSNSELIVGGECHFNLYNAVKDPSVDEMVQHIKNIVFDTEEVRKNYAVGERAKDPCYYFGNLIDVGCTVKDALQHPNKVINSWVYWYIAENYYNDELSVLDGDGKDVTDNLIPSDAQRIANAIKRVANKDVYSIIIKDCDIHFY